MFAKQVSRPILASVAPGASGAKGIPQLYHLTVQAHATGQYSKHQGSVVLGGVEDSAYSVQQGDVFILLQRVLL